MKFKAPNLFLILLFAAILCSPALANPTPGVEERLQALEKQQVEIYHTLEEKKEAGLATRIAERITLSGLLEIEGFYEDLDLRGGPSESASDLVLATAQLAFGIELSEHLTSDLIFLFEEDATEPIEVDEATINFAAGRWSGRFGRQYVPFGAFHSHFISDPLTLELGETRETALLLTRTGKFYALSAFLFNGDAERFGQEDHIRDWGASLALTPMEGIEIGGSFLSDLADTDAALMDDFNQDPDGLYFDSVAGWSAYLVAELGKFALAGEVLGALERFDAANLDADLDGRGDRPLAWNLELAVYPAEAWEFAAKVEKSREFFGFPELQYGLDATWAFRESMTFSMEYLRGEFDEAFGDGTRERNLITAQLAFVF